MGRIARALGLAGTLILALTTTALAQNTVFTKWLCVFDLEEALGPDFVTFGPLPREITTTDTTKACTGSNIPTENTKIDCTAQLPPGVWTGGQKNYLNVPCQIFQGQCGTPGFVWAQGGRLSISSSGKLVLSCARN